MAVTVVRVPTFKLVVRSYSVGGEESGPASDVIDTVGSSSAISREQTPLARGKPFSCWCILRLHREAIDWCIWCNVVC